MRQGNRRIPVLRFILLVLIAALLLSACAGQPSPGPVNATPTAPAPLPMTGATATPAGTPAVEASPVGTAAPLPPVISTPAAAVSTLASRLKAISLGGGKSLPVFSHVIIIMLENNGYQQVIGNSAMPNFNQWVRQYTLLTNYYAVAHPSLPNYLALVSGSTNNINVDCLSCYLQAKSLPDLLDANQRTWKTYQESMPSPCYVGNSGLYDQNHNPFVYFDSIRLDTALCQKSVVPFTQFSTDLSNGNLPDFSFIMPNLCDSGHSCGLDVVDGWLGKVVPQITQSPAFDDHSLLVISFDEGEGDGPGSNASNTDGGQVATVLISPLVKGGFQDNTLYTHYSLLKTISTSWGLPLLGHAADSQTNIIADPWK